MSLDIAQLGFQVDASQLDRGTKSLDRFGKSSGAAATAADLAKKAFVGLTAALSIQGIGRAASSYDDMSNSLRVLGLDGDQVSKTLAEIGGIASRTRTPIESMVDLYQRTSIAARELGVSQQEISGFTEAVGTALAVQGTSAQEASGALQQLTQALAGGVVRAEEFSSILEGAPTLVLAAAEGIDEAGGSVGRLRQMMLDGEISSREFFDAILSQSDELQAKLGMTSITIGQAFTNLSNGFKQLVGVLNNGTGVTATFAAAVNALGVGMGNLANYLQENGEVLQRITSYAVAAAAIYGGTLAVSLGTTLVKATVSAVSSQMALEIALGATSKGAAAASIATKVFAGALGLLKKALVVTGIGALVVLGGELINKFRDLVRATGGVGNAFSALGDLAGLVWQGIIDSAGAIPPALSYVWNSIKAGFLGVMQSIQYAWAKTLKAFSAGLSLIGADSMASSLSEAYVSALDASTETLRASTEAMKAASAAKATAAATVSDAFAPVSDKLSELNEITKEVSSSAADMGDTYGNAGEIASGAGGKASKAAKAAASATKDLLAELNKELDAREELIGLSDEERAAKESLQSVQQKLGDEIGNYSQAAIQAAADRIVAIDQEEDRWQTYTDRVGEFTDIMADGLFSGFKDTLGSIKDMFVGWLKQMISLALKNKIIVNMGAQFGATGGGLMQQVGGLLGGDPLSAALSNAGVAGVAGGGMLGGILGTWGGSGGLLGGLSSVVGGLTSGGIGGAFSGLTSSLAGIAQGVSGFAGAIGAALPVVGIAAAAFSLLKGKVKELDRGLKITIGTTQDLIDEFSKDTAFGGAGKELEDALKSVGDGISAIVESFTKSQKSYAGGLVKKKKFNDEPLFGEDSAPILSVIEELLGGVNDMANGLGIASDVFKGFTTELMVSTKGMSEDEATAALSEALGGLTDDFAAMIPGIEKYQLENEGAADTLNRLATSVQGVNAMFDQLGLKLYQTTLAGADMASGLADLFGGLEQFGQATGFYYQNFYSEAERLGHLAGMTAAEFDKLGISMPTSVESMRALVDGIDLTTASGQELFATLIQLAPAVNSLIGVERQRADLLFSLLSEEEQAAARNRELTKTFADLGLQMPKTREGFAKIISGLDLTSEAGIKAFWVLSDAAPAVDQLIDAEQRRAEQLKLLTEEQLAAAEQLTAEQLALAQKRTDLLFSLMSEEEQAAARTRELQKTFADLGIALPKTSEGFAAIIKGLDLTSEAGIRAFGLLSGVAQDFLSSVEAQKITGAGPAAPSASSGGSSRPRSSSGPSNQQDKRDAAKSERERLEEQLLRLQGNTVELRRRELKAISAGNRGLQEQIWALEDAKDAMDALQPSRFATLAEYQLEAARQAQTLMRQGRSSGEIEQAEAAREEDRTARDRWQASMDQMKATMQEYLPLLYDIYRLDRDRETV